MERQGVEPGLLSIFRVYVVLRFVAMLAVAEFFFLRYGPTLAPLEVPYIVLFGWNIFFLLIYLYWPWPQHKLGRIYLPVALIVASIGPILEGRYLFLVYDAAYEARFWLVFPFLVIPLILTAWQYNFRYVVVLCFATALLEAFLIRSLPVLDSGQAMSDMSYLVVRTVFFVLIGYIVSHLMIEQREQRRELAEANRKLVRYAATLEQLTISQERNRLARELHDTLAHTLSGLAVHLDAIAALWPDDADHADQSRADQSRADESWRLMDISPRARDMLQQALTITREGLDETRRAMHALRAMPLEQEGLALAVRSLAESAAVRGGLSLQLDIEEHPGPLDPEVEQCYYRVAQEAVENVIKHAGAKSLTVSLGWEQERLVLEVVDDGRGLSRGWGEQGGVARDVQGDGDGSGKTQFGLRGMRERAELIGASLEIKSRPGQGTTIRLSSGGIRERSENVRKI